jgi:hypothetical protein
MRLDHAGALFGVHGQRRFAGGDEFVVVVAMATTSPYGASTSAIAVLTIGSSAAMYSSTLVGLMKRVASLSANGSRHTSQPARNCGSAW